MQRPDYASTPETLKTTRRLVPVLASEWSGFPAALPSLFGREPEITQVSSLLQHPHNRLVSLLGPGGVGKTRLAIAIAEHAETAFPDGIAFVSLAPLNQPGDVPLAVAATLGVISHPDRTTTQSVVAALQERHTLLILDNLEHLQSQAVAEFVLELLERCPRLWILSTSREPLRITCEQRYLTPPLHTLAIGRDAHAAAELPAVQLFVARACAVRQDFALGPGDAAVVAEICHRLDGLPLAIELAAAWMRVLNPAALLARLTERLPLLSGNNADQPARFQTMRAAIRWSYDLLTPDEAQALRRLSVFRGGFTLEAAASVALTDEKNSPERDLRILNLVATLCDKSLLAPTDSIGSDQRFTMLETVREYANEQLAESEDLARTRVAHAAYFQDWMERVEPDFLGPQEEHWIEFFTAEIGNLQLALYWGIQYDAELAQRSGAALWAYWASTNPREGLRWLTDALGATGATTPTVRSRVLRTAGAMAVLIGNYEKATSLATEALELAIQAEAPWLEGEARWILSLCDIFAGRLEQAESHLTRALVLFDPAQTPTEMTIAAYARTHLGVVAFLSGNPARGVEMYDRAVSELRAVGCVGVAMIAFTEYAGFLVLLERLTQARQLLHEALHFARRTPSSWLVGGILISLALADAMDGQAVSAASKLGALEAIRTSRGIAVPIQFQQRIEQASILANSALEPLAFAEAFEHGRINCSEIVDQLLASTRPLPYDDVPQQAARRLGISRRECDVLPYLVAGLSDREIAANLFISHRTASSHVGSILQRLGASSRADAAVRAVRLGLV